MKVFFDTVGCRLNQAEIEHLAGQFRAAGHQIVDLAEGADLVIINSCSVTAAAASDSRQKVRQANQAGAHRIILTGCWATLEPEKAAGLPGVSEVVSNLDKMNIPVKILEPDHQDFDLEPIARKPLPGSHQRTRAFIKAQDGCDNFCTFCVTRLARGVGRSIPKVEVLNEIHLAELGGVKEIVLTGVHLGSWGKDKGEGEVITDLVEFILHHSNVERMRLSSVEPWDLDDRFFDLWQNPRLCRHLHLPLQSGSSTVLKRMARHTTTDAFSKLIEMARKKIEGIALTTDIIVGFPGETSAEFEESLEFVRQMEFSAAHIFKYSPREGTVAARMPDRVNGQIARERAEKMHLVVKASESNFLKESVGTKVKVLWEGSSTPNSHGWTLHGLNDQYIKVEAKAETNRWNKIDSVLIGIITPDGVTGKILNPDD